jgi:adenylate cyclase
VEIERKWLVPDAPASVLKVDGEAIDQGYLVVDPDGGEVRVRRRAGRFSLTVKAGRGLARSEHEIALTGEQFDALWPATEGRRVEKVRRLTSEPGGVVELDVYAGALAGLVVAEVEFPDTQAAAAFSAPAWFGREVTDDDAYKNRRLALAGRPADPA